MRIAVTSCWHLHGEDLHDRIYWIDRALKDMRDLGVSLVLHCGDLFHYARIGTKSAPAPVVIEALKGVVSRHRLPVFLAEGNHDQVEGHDCSAVRALDGMPYLSYFGRLPGFDLGEGLPGLGFVASDWHPNQTVEEWREHLKERVRWVGKPDVVVYGHADLVEASKVGVHSGSWPRPSLQDLQEVVRDVGDVRVWGFFGHNHAGTDLEGHGRAYVMGVGALVRTRWDEAGNHDGWVLLDTDRLDHEGARWATLIPLNGPKFLDLTQCKVPFFREEFPLGSVVRVLTSQVPDALARGFSISEVRMEVVPDAPEERPRSETMRTSVRLGMTMPEALRRWGEDESEDVVEATRILKSLHEAVPSRGQVRVSGITDVGLKNHVAGLDSVYLCPTGWNVLLGPTGCGKSSLLEAPFAALYGYWPSPYRKSMWGAFVDGRGSVSTRVRLTTGELVTVTRAKEGSPSLKVSLDGEVTTTYTQPTKAQPVLDRLVDDPDLWLRSGFLTQDHSPDLVEATPEERVGVFNRVLGLDAVASVRSVVAEALRVLAPVERELKTAESEVETRDLDLQQLRSDIDHWTAELQSKLKILRSAEAENSEAVALQQRMQGADEIEYLRGRVASAPLEGEVERAEALVSRLGSELVEVQEARLRAEEDDAARKAGARAREHLACVGCFPDFLPCPLITEAHRSVERAEGLDPVDVESLKVKHAELTRSRERAISAHQDLVVNAKASAAALERLRHIEEGLPDGPAPDPAMFEAAKRNLEAAEREVMDHRVRLSALRARADEKQGNRNQWAYRMAKLEEQVRDLPALRVLERAFARGGIQRALLEQGIPGIQGELDALLRYPGLDGLRVQVDYAADDPKAVPTILVSVDGGPWAEARVRSGGQRAVVRLLVRLACCLWVAKSSSTAGVLVLDEPTAGVSEDYSSALASILRDLVHPHGPFSQGILATHDEVLAQSLGGRVVRP